MSETVVVTRNGLGSWYLFGSHAEADEHPLVQYGDVICEGPGSIEKNWNYLDLPDLLRTLGDEAFRAYFLREVNSIGKTNWTRVLDLHRRRVWAMMLGLCSSPPDDPATICNLVRQDRRISLKEKRPMAKEATAVNADTKNTAATATGETAEKKAPVRPVREPKFSGDMKITLLADENGAVYGKDHNPKRAGSKSAERFALYTNGMTVDQALAAGISRADMDHDTGRKYISIR